MRQWSLWSNPVPLSLIQCTCVVPLFLRCCVICHMVLIAQCGKVLWLPLRSYRLYNRISHFRFDTGNKTQYSICSHMTIPILLRSHRGTPEICPVCIKVLEGNKVIVDLLQWIIKCRPYWLFRLQLGQEWRWLLFHIRTSLYYSQLCNQLGIPTSKDSCTFSGRIRIHGAHISRSPMCLA